MRAHADGRTVLGVCASKWLDSLALEILLVHHPAASPVSCGCPVQLCSEDMPSAMTAMSDEHKHMRRARARIVLEGVDA